METERPVVKFTGPYMERYKQPLRFFFETRKETSRMSKIVCGFLGGIIATINNLVWMFLGLLLGCLLLDRKPNVPYHVKYNERGNADWKR